MTCFPWPGLPWISQSCPADRDRATPRASSASFPGNIYGPGLRGLCTRYGYCPHDFRLSLSHKAAHSSAQDGPNENSQQLMTMTLPKHDNDPAKVLQTLRKANFNRTMAGKRQFDERFSRLQGHGPKVHATWA